MYKEGFQGALKDKLKLFYLNRDFSVSNANIASRVTSIFFTSIISIFIALWENLGIFFPVLIADIVMLGLAKESTGELHMPNGMHLGFNYLLWTDCLKQSL